MPRKIVEAYDDNDQLIEKYHVSFGHIGPTKTREEDYIKLAKEDHQADGYNIDLVRKWIVRDLRPGEN